MIINNMDEGLNKIYKAKEKYLARRGRLHPH